MPEETLYTEEKAGKEEPFAGEAAWEKETGAGGEARTDERKTEEEAGKSELESEEPIKDEPEAESWEAESKAEEPEKEESEPEGPEKEEPEAESGEAESEPEEAAKEETGTEEVGEDESEAEEVIQEESEVEAVTEDEPEDEKSVKEESGIEQAGENKVVMEDVYGEKIDIEEIIDKGEGEEKMAEQDWNVSADEEKPELEFIEEEPKKRGFFRRNREEAHFLRDKWILSRIRDEDLMEYLILEQKRNEQLQQAKDIREKRFISAFKLSVSLAAGVAVVYLLKDNPTIFVNILYIGGILGGFWFWKNFHEK